LVTEYNELRPYLKDFEKVMHLESWMQRNGSDTSKLKLEFYDESFRGVHAKEDIKKNEIILFVPRSQIVAYEHI
jgi:protein-histidine N-methyltransferase